MKLVVNNSWLRWTLLAALALFTEHGTAQSVALLQSAAVSHDHIWLSDLLPPEAPIEMRRASEQIELGRTPQCRSVRIFQPSDIERRTSSSPALQELKYPAPVSIQRACYPVRREAVQQLIAEFTQEKQIPSPKAPLQWDELIYASNENPALEIVQAIPDPARPVLQVRLRCVERSVCPSFWVAVPCGPRPHLSSAAEINRSAAVPPTEKDAALVESGQRAMLILDNPPMRIQLLVTCLQRGWLGKQIRVMDPSTHRVFRAEVTGAGTLMAHL